jgi:hypothetical protein
MARSTKGRDTRPDAKEPIMNWRGLVMKTTDGGNGHTGTPRIVPGVQPAEAHDRKGRKREAKRRRDAQRLPDSYECFKILLEVIGEQRHGCCGKKNGEVNSPTPG